MQRAVLDTNILVSALIKPQGPPGQVVAAVFSGKLVPVLNLAMLDEYRAVLHRPRLGLDRARVDEALSALAALGEVLEGIDTAPTPSGWPDPSDWPFAACALAAGCPVVTGNTRHFPAHPGLQVMTARACVDTMT